MLYSIYIYYITIYATKALNASWCRPDVWRKIGKHVLARQVTRSKLSYGKARILDLKKSQKKVKKKSTGKVKVKKKSN